jgi:GNAT superfamily N-acetyltransferase
MSTPGIRAVSTAEDVDAAGRLIAASFDHLDANHYLIPDPARRLDAMQVFFGVLTEHAANGAGKVLLTEDGTATAVWFDRTVEPSEPDGYAERITAAAGEYADRFAALDELFEANHPTPPHWHLAFLAVHPDHWGRGLGGALMDHTHSWLDKEGLPAYLEATNADNQRVYRRHGYTDMTPSAIVLGDPTAAGGHATFYRMWRDSGAQTVTTA